MKWFRRSAEVLMGLMSLALLLFAALGVTYCWNRLAQGVFGR